MNKPAFCASCPINAYTGVGYVPPQQTNSSFIIIGNAPSPQDIEYAKPFAGGVGAWLDSALRAARIAKDKINLTTLVGCRCSAGFPGCREDKELPRALARQGVEYCIENRLRPILNSKNWGKVIALGEEALQALTGMAGITLWRGSPLPLKWDLAGGSKVIPTLGPDALIKQPQMFSVVVRDLQKNPSLPKENYTLFPTIEQGRNYISKEFAFDFEWDPDTKAITICGLTDKTGECIVVPHEGEYLVELKRIFENATDIIGHNIVGADTSYFEKLGWNVTAKLWDTMLMQHLVQPDMRHGLNFVASVFTSKVFWKGRGEEKEDDDGGMVSGSGAQWKTWTNPSALPRELGGYGGCASNEEAFRLYNARDTDGSYQCWLPLRNAIKRYELEEVYWNVSVPIAHIFRDISDAGIKIDSSRLREITTSLDKKIEELEAMLPEALRPRYADVGRMRKAPEGTYKQKEKRCVGTKKVPHEGFIYTYTTPDEPTVQCPYCAKALPAGKMSAVKTIRVVEQELVKPINSSAKLIEYANSVGLKMKKKVKTDKITADKNARKGWARTNPEFIIVNEITTLTKLRSTFATEALLHEERMYFNLMPTGTSEGRASSGGQRRGIDYNAQNIPSGIRKIFTVDSAGQAMINFDIASGENMLTAYLARDFERLERLNQPNYSEHADLASQMFGFTVDKNLKEHKHLYKAGKITNHGRNYGLGVKKMHEQFLDEGMDFSEADTKEFIEIWKKLNKRTAEWQNETIALASKQGYLANVFGRRRWFQSRDYATKALAFLPASTLADVVIRMMIAHFPEKFAKECSALQLRCTAPLMPGWRLWLQVHDSIMLVGPAETWKEQAIRTEAIMTQQWKALQDFALGVEGEVALPSLERALPGWGDLERFNIN